MKQFNPLTILFILSFSIYFLCGCSSPQSQSNNYLTPSMRYGLGSTAEKTESELPYSDYINQYMKRMNSNFPDGKPWYGYRAGRTDIWSHKYRDDVYWSWNLK
jgi:hypothetical protein